MRISDWSSDVCSSDLLAVVAGLDVAAELHADGLLAVADAEDRQPQPEHLFRRARREFFRGRCRTAGEDDALQRAVVIDHVQAFIRLLERHDLAVDAGLAHAAGDQLGDLRSEIDNKNALRHRRSEEPLSELNGMRSEEHTSELQSLMRTSYAVFCLKQKTNTT